MDAMEIRKKFLTFFQERGHAIVSSSSLIPDDPSVLLTTAGMQQFKPYYTGDADPVRDFGSKNTASIQKSFRTSDIDEVGDESHLTFFEMLGNFSFGGYVKKDAISYAHDFITKEMGLSISFVSIFEGSENVPKDDESKAIWQSLGVKDIREMGMHEVFWGPTGTAGPCGPTTEIYCKNGNGKDIEIWNIVFNEFFCDGSREQLLAGTTKLLPLAIKGVDTGMGLERLAMISQKTKTIFETDLLIPLISLLPSELDRRKKRIIVDHVRGTVFLLADGVRPSNKEAGYILRRLIRRVTGYEKIDSVPSHAIDAMVHEVIHEYGDFYLELLKNAEHIQKEVRDERGRFEKTLKEGLRELEKRYPTPEAQINAPDNWGRYKTFPVGRYVGKEVADLYQTYGLPIEIIREHLEKNFYTFDEKEFKNALEEAFHKHQEISRAGVEKKFGGHGLVLDTGELKAGSEEELKIVTRLHTATHLMNAVLRTVLGAEVEQKGSDITAERTRFDFSFSRKLTPEETQEVERLVNEAIKNDYPVTARKLSLDEAKGMGALFMKKGKYPERVTVYTVGNEKEIFSQELCGGPHVVRTGEIGKFKIIKEEASSAGVRRIRAIIE
ncbi:MAG: alanine--tRNA ligase-related protein [Patescibacteria group bacterium]